jgi:hypothetical protein
MTLIAWKDGPVFRDGAVGTGSECCCTTIYCPTKCSGAGLPLELLFSIKTFVHSGDIVFDPIGDWIITLNTTNCTDYGGSFHPHTAPGPSPCFPPLCFAACSHKLIIGMTVGSGGAGVSVLVADYSSGGLDAGGRSVVGTDHISDICSGSYPITGSLSPSYCLGFTMDYEITLP